jgi:hypothetical protein
MLTMARKKKAGGRPKSTEPTRSVILSFRATEAYATWLDGLVDHCRKGADYDGLPVTAVVEQALKCLARERGYDPDPPKR